MTDVGAVLIARLQQAEGLEDAGRLQLLLEVVTVLLEQHRSSPSLDREKRIAMQEEIRKLAAQVGVCGVTMQQ